MQATMDQLLYATNDSAATIASGWISFWGAFLGALIGAIATIIAVRMTIKSGNRQREQDLINQAKPIIINYDSYQIQDEKTIAQIVFQADGEDSSICIGGTYKNTDNGILFLDLIETEYKKYYPVNIATVDKNTIFHIYVKIVNGETLTKWVIYCHDIYENPYKYNINIHPERTENSMEIISREPIPTKNKKSYR